MINFSIIEKVSGDKYYEYIIILAPPRKKRLNYPKQIVSLFLFCALLVKKVGQTMPLTFIASAMLPRATMYAATRSGTPYSFALS